MLEDKAEGLFQYARLLEVQLAQQKVRNEGLKVKIEELDGLPQGLGEMYATNFNRVFKVRRGAADQAVETSHVPCNAVRCSRSGLLCFSLFSSRCSVRCDATRSVGCVCGG